MTKDGNRTITVEEFYNYMNVLKPNSFTCLPDEVWGDQLVMIV